MLSRTIQDSAVPCAAPSPAPWLKAGGTCSHHTGPAWQTPTCTCIIIMIIIIVIIIIMIIIVIIQCTNNVCKRSLCSISIKASINSMCGRRSKRQQQAVAAAQQQASASALAAAQQQASASALAAARQPGIVSFSRQPWLRGALPSSCPPPATVKKPHHPSIHLWLLLHCLTPSSPNLSRVVEPRRATP